MCVLPGLMSGVVVAERQYKLFNHLVLEDMLEDLAGVTRSLASTSAQLLL